MSPLQSIGRRVACLARHLRNAREGVAAVEFALLVPFLLLLYMGTIEISDLIAVDRRVSIVSGTTGDLVARTDASLDTATLNDYFQAAEGIILPYSSTGLEQVITCVAVDANGNTTVAWSRGYNGGTANTVGQTYALPSAMTDISRSSWVIVSTSSYSYKPLLGMVISTAINLRRETYYLPRYGQYIALT